MFRYILLITLIINLSNSLINEHVLDESINFKFQWELIENEEILITLSANSKSWIGIGFGSENDDGMVNVDYMVGSFDNVTGNLKVNDMVVLKSSTSNKPQLDTKVGGTDDILTSIGYQTSDYTFIKFTRKLKTNDSSDRELVSDGGMTMTRLLWAIGQSQSFGYHGQVNRGQVLIDLSNSNGVSTIESSSGKYLNWHVALMLASFLILMPFGIFVARYMKNYHYWFPLHYLLLGTAFTFSIVAFILAFLMTSDRKFSKTLIHAWFGLFTIILMSIVVIIGVMSHLMYNPNRKNTPIQDLIHAFLARFTYLIGLVSIWTGLNTYQIPNQYSIVLGFVITLFIGLVIFLEIYKKRYNPMNGSKNINLENINKNRSGSELNVNN